MEGTEWLQKRLGHVGASEAASILGFGYDSILDVYARKLGLKDEALDTEPMRWGHRLQVAIAQGYGEDTGRQVLPWPEFEFTTCRQFPIAGCTPDATQYRQDRRAVGCLEIKNVSTFAAKDWQEEVPVRHQIQLQHQILVMDHEWGTVAGLVGGARLLWKDYDRDEPFIESVLKPALSQFWACVENKTPPALADFTNVDLDLLARVYPAPKTVTPVEVILPLRFEDLDEIIRERSQIEKMAGAEVEEAKNKIREYLGRHGAEVGILENGVRYHWKPNEKGQRRLYRREPA